MGCTFYYFSFVYIPMYMTQHVGLSIEKTSLFISIMMGCMIIMVPFAGLLIIITIPGFYFLQQQMLWIAAPIILLFTLASSMDHGSTPITIIENFPSTARHSGIALGYNLGNGFLGGTVPLFCEYYYAS
jgi:hypothetical protein